MNQTKKNFYYIILSIIAAAIILILTLVEPRTIDTITIGDKLFVSGAFITSCIFGISIAVYPNWFKKLMKQEKHSVNKQQVQKTKREYQGHHPDCRQFLTHTVKIKNKTLCAGCLGLSIGSIISILLIVIYIIILPEQPRAMYRILIILGLAIISLIYIEMILPNRNSIIHVISNTLLVLSFLIIAISVLEITGNRIYTVITILLCFLWLDTRVQLSKWQHIRICGNCTETCKTY